MKIYNNFKILISEDLSTYLKLNYIFYGIVFLGMLFSIIFPETQQWLSEIVKIKIRNDYEFLVDALENKEFLLTIFYIFLVNYIIGTILSIAAVSYIIPFSGFLIAAWRLFLFGIVLSPTTSEAQLYFIPILVLLFLECQGFIIAMFGIHKSTQWFLFPKKYNLQSRKASFIQGLKYNLSIQKYVIFVLFVAAIYETLMKMYFT